MKYFSLPIFILVFFISKTAIPQTPHNPGVYGAGITVNYVRKFISMSPQTDPNAIPTLTVKNAKQITQYVDGLGREIQQVIKNGAMATGESAYDLVQSTVYDQYGREAYQYLPYRSSTSSGNFQTNPFNSQVSFYVGTNSPLSGQAESYYYNKREYEASPLNRPIKQLPAGTNWVGNNIGTVTFYGVNTLADEVAEWNTSPVVGIAYAAFNRVRSYIPGITLP